MAILNTVAQAYVQTFTTLPITLHNNLQNTFHIQYIHMYCVLYLQAIVLCCGQFYVTGLGTPWQDKAQQQHTLVILHQQGLPHTKISKQTGFLRCAVQAI